MAIIRYITIAFLALSLAGCSLFENKSSKEDISLKRLKAMTVSAVNGDKTDNGKLSNLVDLSLPVNTNYNSLSVDSLTAGKKKYYLVILQYPNPLYNRFAVYDSTLKCYLIDKSLNGYFVASNMVIKNDDFIKIVENFNSRDVLNLNRLTLYKFSRTGVNIAFRSFIKLEKEGTEYDQVISEIAKDRIKTDITSTRRSVIDNKSDIFIYDSSLHKYISVNNLFDDFVIDQVNSFNHNDEQPEIKNYQSAMESVGKNIYADTISNAANVSSRYGFSLTIGEDWKEKKDLVISDYFTKQLKGSQYLNEKIGAVITVVKIVPEDSAEMYLRNYKLSRKSEGKYKVRYSQRYIEGHEFVQFFEYACGNNKYVLVLKSSKYTYERFRKVFENIINSFTMDC